VPAAADAGGWVPDQPAFGSATRAARTSEDPWGGAAPRARAASPARVPAGPGVLAALTDALPPWAQAMTGRVPPAAVVAVAAVCALLLALPVLHLVHQRFAGVPAGAGAATAAAPPPPASAVMPPVTPSPAGIVVDVGGRVRRPGLVTLPAGARVADAIRAAGGALHRRDLATVNLAGRVRDGQLLLVGVPGGAVAPAGDGGPAAGGSPGAGAPVSLNAATLADLDALPGIGPVLAQRILDWRQAHGGFRRVEDLQQVSGIGPATFARLAPLVTV
jgi:competence protein ComEA